MGLPTRLSGKQAACQCKRRRRGGFNLWVEKIPWRGKWQPTPVFLPGKFHEQRILAGYSPWGRKESDMTECTRTHTHAHTHACTHVRTHTRTRTHTHAHTHAHAHSVQNILCSCHFHKTLSYFYFQASPFEKHTS